MLEHSTNFERQLDEVLMKAIPYLIFSPPDFAAQLAKAMASMWQAYEDRNSSSAFLQNVEAINKMLDGPEVAWGPGIAQRINSFQRERMSWGERIWNIEKRLDALTAKPKARKAAPVRPTIIQPTAPVAVVQPVAVVEPFARRGRKKLDDTPYLYHLDRFERSLEALGLMPGTRARYLKIARSILVNYGGIPPTEKYHAEIMASDISNELVRDKMNVLRKLGDAVGREALQQQKQPQAFNLKPGNGEVLAREGEHQRAPKDKPKEKEKGTKPGDRKERMKRMTEHYPEGAILTMGELRAFGTSCGEFLSNPAIESTLRIFSKNGYAEKIEGPYTYRRTGKRWDGAVG